MVKLTLQRDIGLLHLRDLLLGLIDSHVAPATQLETEAPHGLPRRETDERAVLLDDLLRARAREEVEVEGAADETVLDQRDVGGRGRKEKNIGAGGAGTL